MQLALAVPEESNGRSHRSDLRWSASGTGMATVSSIVDGTIAAGQPVTSFAVHTAASIQRFPVSAKPESHGSLV